MEQKRPADIIQELLDYLWNGLGLEEKGWKRLKKGDFKKKMKNGLTYQIWFDRSRYNYIDYEIGHGNVEVGFSCIIRQGQVKEGSQMALFPFISLSMRLPFSLSRTSPYATLHNLPAIWCKSGVVVGVVDFRPKCPVYRSDLQRNGLWLPWWLLRKSPS